MALALAPDTVSIITQFLSLCSIEHKDKNWLFIDTQDGANASMIIYSLIETAKANDVDPEKYLEYLLENRPSADWSDEQLEKLAPWSETTREACAI